MTSTVTCQYCNFIVLQNNGKKRTICPNCGTFYCDVPSQQYNKMATNKQGGQVDKTQQDADKQAGRLNTVLTFFQNLTSQKKTSINKEKLAVSEELPPIISSPSQNSSRSPSTSLDRGQIMTPKVKTLTEFRDDLSKSVESEDYTVVNEFYSKTFSTISDLNLIFKIDPSKDYRGLDETGINIEFVDCVYDELKDLPAETHKLLIKAIIRCLLSDKTSLKVMNKPPKKTQSKDEQRAFIILLQNPQFGNISTYVLFAHLLYRVSSLSDHDHHHFVHWLKTLSQKRFKQILTVLQTFVSRRLYPPREKDLPPIFECLWWVPSAAKVLALLYAANKLSKSASVSYREFYNSTLDHLDLMAEYYSWQNPDSQTEFAFCQYPFMLSINAKRMILQRDAEQQMVISARRSLVAKVQRRQLPDMTMLFLNLTVRRSHLVSDSLSEISKKHLDLKKKLKVTFTGEPGLDMGGLTKEWFLLLIREIFRPEYGMFSYDKRSGVYWFSSTQCENFSEFNLVGVLMGLAVYNSIILDIRFPLVCYRKLLSPAVVPYDNPRAIVGRVAADLSDLKSIQPEVSQGLQELLDYEGDVEDDFGLTFQITYKDLDQIRSNSLKPGGEEIPVTNDNKREYVKLYVDWKINKSIFYQFQAFYHGFHSVCASNALTMLRPEEVEMLVCGSPTLDMEELKSITVYEGYTVQDITIKCFWETVCNFKVLLQKQFMVFTTGSDRVPITGMADMTFKITRVDGVDLLPMSHTCFNQLLLPPYRTKRTLKSKLLTAIQNAEGFGLE